MGAIWVERQVLTSKVKKGLSQQAMQGQPLASDSNRPYLQEPCYLGLGSERSCRLLRRTVTPGWAWRLKPLIPAL